MGQADVTNGSVYQVTQLCSMKSFKDQNQHTEFNPEVNWQAIQLTEQNCYMHCSRSRNKTWHTTWSCARGLLDRIATCCSCRRCETRKIPRLYTGSFLNSATPFSTKDEVVLESEGPKSRALSRCSWNLMFPGEPSPKEPHKRIKGRFSPLQPRQLVLTLEKRGDPAQYNALHLQSLELIQNTTISSTEGNCKVNYSKGECTTSIPTQSEIIQKLDQCHFCPIPRHESWLEGYK